MEYTEFLLVYSGHTVESTSNTNLRNVYIVNGLFYDNMTTNGSVWGTHQGSNYRINFILI